MMIHFKRNPTLLFPSIFNQRQFNNTILLKIELFRTYYLWNLYFLFKRNN
jgi:hypothetical protein